MFRVPFPCQGVLTIQVFSSSHLRLCGGNMIAQSPEARFVDPALLVKLFSHSAMKTGSRSAMPLYFSSNIDNEALRLISPIILVLSDIREF